MLRINVETIPHSQQRYDTVGDWIWVGDESWEIYVSDLGDWRMETAVAIHEIVECALCKFADISQAEVDTFDQTHEELDEPGDSPEAPYQCQHSVAAAVERLVLAMLQVNWEEYEEKCRNLGLTSYRSKETEPDSPSD